MILSPAFSPELRNKVRCVFPTIISPEFRIGQYGDDDHREYAPHFNSRSPREKRCELISTRIFEAICLLLQFSISNVLQNNQNNYNKINKNRIKIFGIIFSLNSHQNHSYHFDSSMTLVKIWRALSAILTCNMVSLHFRRFYFDRPKSTHLLYQ